MQLIPFLAHFWSSSQQIKSYETVVELQSSDSKTIEVKNTKSLIDIFVPLPPFDHVTKRFSLKRKSNEYWNFHVIDVAKDSSLHIELKPFNKCLEFDIFLKHGSRPSKTDYDFFWSIPNITRCKNSTFLQNICEEFNHVNDNLRILSDKTSNCTEEEQIIYNRTKLIKSCEPNSDPYRVFVSDVDIRKGISILGKRPIFLLGLLHLLSKEQQRH